jgi:DNA polymerase-3 subunit delta'
VTLYELVIGQDHAVAQLRAAARAPVHAYLLVGPAGAGKRDAALSFGAQLVCEQGGCGECSDCLRAVAGLHPDVRLIARQGARMLVDEAAEVERIATMAPLEARRKVIILEDLHLIEGAAPALLKIIEEPPATTMFVVLAEHVPEDLVTIASRCVTLTFAPVADDVLVAALESEGIDGEAARAAVAVAAGRVDRARLLASDPGLLARLEAWRTIPTRLDGTGASVAGIVDELRALVDGVEKDLLRQRHATEMAELQEREQAYGVRRSGRADLDARHKRERRRLRTDELRLGLATLASSYRANLTGSAGEARAALEAVAAIGETGEGLVRNPGELLLLQGLLARLNVVATT